MSADQENSTASQESIPKSMRAINPMTLAEVETLMTEEAAVSELISRARQASERWSEISLKERSRQLIRLGERITQERDVGARLIAEETGRALSLAALSELNTVQSFIKAAISEARIALKETKVKLSPLDFPGKSAIVEQVPRGVIGIIAPWNYPVSNFYKSLFPALLSGNAVVMKPSEHTPRVGAWLADLATEVLGEDLVLCVQGGASVGRALVEGGVDSVVFTGSVATGRAVAALAAHQLIPCSLELGGKDAALVLADADLDRTALGIAQWSMFNSGQDCSSIERLYVMDRIADSFIERLNTVISHLTYHGDGRLKPEEEADIGPLQTAEQLAVVNKHVGQAVAEGALVLCGGKPSGVGYGFQPTLLDRCVEGMLVTEEETFGPVIAVIRVHTVDEAIERINRSRYGLNGSVWTSNIAVGRAIAKRLDVGIALVNNHSFTGSLPQMPWTGVKETGYGVASSRWAYHTFVRPRTIVLDKNKDPDPFWFPVDESYQRFVEAVALKNLGGGIGVLFRLIGLLRKRIKATKSLLHPTEDDR